MAGLFPTLNKNKVYTAHDVYDGLRNQIIANEVWADNIAGTYGDFCEASRVSAGPWGDTITYTATDALFPLDYTPDTADQLNVLKSYRADVKLDYITCDIFKQIAITTDAFCTKQAFGNEGEFANFNSVLLGWLRDTKRIADSTRFNVFVGNAKSSVGKQDRRMVIASGASFGKTIAKDIADAVVEITDVSRDYNDNGFMRSYAKSDLVLLMPASIANTITKVDEPSLFKSLGLTEGLTTYVLPDKYFGVGPVGTSGTVTTTAGSHRAYDLVTIDGVNYFPGEVIATGVAAPKDKVYATTDPKIAYKICHKQSVPLMSGFEVSSEFVNGQNLSTNTYLTYGSNELKYMADKPFVTAIYTQQ